MVTLDARRGRSLKWQHLAMTQRKKIPTMGKISETGEDPSDSASIVTTIPKRRRTKGRWKRSVWHVAVLRQRDVVMLNHNSKGKISVFALHATRKYPEANGT